MKILVVNTGSSSLKYRLLDMPDGSVLCKGLLERIGLDGTRLRHSRGDEEHVFDAPDVRNHLDGVGLVLGKILDNDAGVVGDIGEIAAVGHRTVHGGEHFAASVLITEEVISTIRECIPLAPLHNPANLAGIEATRELLPDAPQVAVFDTAFHQTMPEHAFIYPLPYEFYETYRLRRYGFHGTSHRYVSSKACEFSGMDLGAAKIITCHLGNGSSIAAVDRGKSVDTSMGFTPLEGLMMGTRCGDIDPSIHRFLMEAEGLSIGELNGLLNRHSGLLGVSGISSDIRDVRKAAEEGSKQARIALDIYCYRIRKYIGAYAAAMGGVDVVVFTAGIGENNPDVRAESCRGLGFLGIEIDPERNACIGELRLISSDTGRVKVLTVPTDEELMIAADTYEIVRGG
jgi:acetate kinase